jgi:tetratricopeptide (TPR) repeat protein
MRALLYRDVVDLLTDYSFVKSRMSVLEFRRAAQMHVSDAEELYNCINTFVAKYPNVSIDVNVDQVLVESYKLVGSVMHSEDSNRWQDEDIGEDDLDEKLDDESSSSITRVHSVSKALQALGDSLCRHNLKSEAMKFYYRAMLKFESINAAISDQVEKTESDTSKSPFMTTSHSHLLMGGILSRIGSVYESQNDIIDAMLCYERTLSFYSRHKSKHHTKGVAKVLASMGQMHFNLKEYEPALSCLQESLALWKSMDDDVEDDIANLLILMGNARREMGQLNEAICLFSEAMYDKVNVYGKSHPEVGFLHQTIGVVFCDKGEFEKGLSHFEDALRIRESALESVLSHFDYKYNAINDRVKAREIEVAECLRCIGQLHENCGDLEESFSHFVGNISIYRSHLITTVSNQATIMVSDLVNFLKDESSESTEVSNLYRHLIQAIQVGRQIYSIDTDKSDSNVDDEDIENLLELESQIAEILYDFGLIEGAQYLYRIKLNGSEDAVKLNEALRSDAKAHFEQSILIRKRMMKRLESFDSQDDNNTLDYEKITIALISYELGKLYSCQQHNMEDKDFKKRRSISFVGKPIAKDCIAAVSYFEDARETLEESIEMAETLDFINDEDDCWISRVHKTPEIYEEMLQTMAVLYRKLDEYDKSVECYNKVSMLLTRQEISEDDLEPNAEKGMLLCQKEKVAFSSQSIGEVLFDTGEYSRALKSYDEALQLRRSIESDSFAVADTLCLKGTVLLKLKKWDDAILTFDEAYRIRVDKLSRDHQDVARCFHFIGKAYAGDEKLQQAIEYFKKAQKIFSGHLNDTDINAADLFFDLGKIILQKEALSKHFHCEEPSEDDISLALICLALCRDIYKRNFGDTALEVGDVLNLLGLIYMKYGEYSKAITSFETALKIFHGAPLDQNLRIAKSLNNLGLSLTLSGTKDHDIIFEYLVLAKHIYEEKGACNTESYGELMYNMGEVNIRNDDIAEATTCYEIALATYEAVLGKEHVSISHSLEKLGTCLIRERKHNAAMKVLQKAIEIRSKHDHDRDLHSADIYFNMGIIHCETGNLNKAIDCYEEAVNIKTAALGNKDIQVAQILNNIGSVFARNREYQRALKPWQDAVEIYRNAGLSDEDPKVSCTIGNIEISKRFVSPTPVEHSIRNILSY